jgi:hypothetical protein
MLVQPLDAWAAPSMRGIVNNGGERLRYARVLSADLLERTAELTMAQIIALRFVSDAELPALTRKVLDEKLVEGKAIKQLIKNWQPDYLRA